MRHRRIIVVDDDRAAAAEIAESLSEADWVVGCAYSAAEGLQAISEDPDLDAVIADLFMSGQSGFDMMSACHATIRPGLPFIIMTRYPSYELVVRSLRSDAIDFVEKPVSFDDLEKALERALVERERYHWDRRQQANVVSDLIKLRTGIQRVLSPELSSDPCLDLLLHLSDVEREGKTLSISAACTASGVPMTTALRRISDLLGRGLIERHGSESNRRSSFLTLTNGGRARVAEIVRAARLAVAGKHDASAASN